MSASPPHGNDRGNLNPALRDEIYLMENSDDEESTIVGSDHSESQSKGSYTGERVDAMPQSTNMSTNSAEKLEIAARKNQNKFLQFYDNDKDSDSDEEQDNDDESEEDEDADEEETSESDDESSDEEGSHSNYPRYETASNASTVQLTSGQPMYCSTVTNNPSRNDEYDDINSENGAENLSVVTSTSGNVRHIMQKWYANLVTCALPYSLNNLATCGHHDNADDDEQIASSEKHSVISEAGSENRSSESSGSVSTASHGPQMREHRTMTASELTRARLAFQHCSTVTSNRYQPLHGKQSSVPRNDRVMSEEQFYLALALLGEIQFTKRVTNLFQSKKSEFITEDNFLELLRKLLESKAQSQAADSSEPMLDKEQQSGTVSISSNIEEAFDALYEGICPLDDQRDKQGEKFIKKQQLRHILTSRGNKLTDEEADELILECNPHALINVDGSFDEVIYLRQYRSMLLDLYSKFG